MTNPAENQPHDQPDSWKIKPVRESMNELRALWQRKQDAADDYNEACKAVAEKANMQPHAVKTYVNATMRDKLKEHEERAEQLTLLIDEL